jgi:hypothetical protein
MTKTKQGVEKEMSPVNKLERQMEKPVRAWQEICAIRVCWMSETVVRSLTLKGLGKDVISVVTCMANTEWVIRNYFSGNNGCWVWQQQGVKVEGNRFILMLYSRGCCIEAEWLVVESCDQIDGSKRSAHVGLHEWLRCICISKCLQQIKKRVSVSVDGSAWNPGHSHLCVRCDVYILVFPSHSLSGNWGEVVWS